MALNRGQEPYLLAHRRGDVEEDRRLDFQHEAIKHAILDNQLVHPSIPTLGSGCAIADLGCGTGVWLDDVANTLSADGAASSTVLVGFDTNTLAFNANPAPGVELVEHDCTEAFDSRYVGVFDLVNVRGLACALPKDTFPRLVENAVKLLSQNHALQLWGKDRLMFVEPGGYLQWLETETRLWRAYPESAEISEVLATLYTSRLQRGLVPYLPHFMLSQLLSPNLGANFSQAHSVGGVMSIINFNLLPGGISRQSYCDDIRWNERFSDTVLESMKAALNGSLTSNASQTAEERHAREAGTGQSLSIKIRKLIRFIEKSQKSNSIKMGGLFPQLIAQKLQHV